MKNLIFACILSLSLAFLSCEKDDKQPVNNNNNNTTNEPVKKLEGTWQYSYMDFEIYDSTGKYESKYNQNLTGQILELKEDKTFQFINPAKPETNKTGNWQSIDSTKLVLGNDTFSITRFTHDRLTYKSSFINFIEKPGHLGPNDKPVPKKRIEVFYLSK